MKWKREYNGRSTQKDDRTCFCTLQFADVQVISANVQDGLENMALKLK